MTWKIGLCWLLLTGMVLSSPKKNVLIRLNNENWKTMIDHHSMMLVLFHSTDCVYSIALKEELEHLKKLLDFQNSKIDLAELDVYDYQPIMRNMGAKGEVPFVSFFFDGKPHTFNKKHPTLKDIRKFMRDVYFSKHFLHPKSEAELKSLLLKKDLSVIFSGQHDHANFYDIVDWSMSHISLDPQFIVYSNKTELLPGLRHNHAALYRKSDLATFHFTKTHYNKHTLEQWIYAHSHPSLGRLDSTGYKRVIHDGNAAVVLFARTLQEETKLLQETKFVEIADKNYKKMLVMVCNLKDDSSCGKLIDLAQIYEEELPCVKVVHSPEGDSSDFVLKFSIPDSPLTEQGVQRLIDEYQAGHLDPEIRSEPELDDADTHFQHLVGSNIGKRLNYQARKNHDLVVLFHNGESDPASLLALQRFTNTVELLHGYRNTIMFSAYDCKKNARIGLSLAGKSLPLLRLYRKDDKKHYSELEVKNRHKEVLHFLIDRSTEEIHLDDHFEEDFQDL